MIRQAEAVWDQLKATHTVQRFGMFVPPPDTSTSNPLDLFNFGDPSPALIPLEVLVRTEFPEIAAKPTVLIPML